MGDSIQMFQIKEDDLAELERLLPRVLEQMSPVHLAADAVGANKLRTRWRRIQQIVMDVRWNYGPWSDVTSIPAGDEPPDDRVGDVGSS